MRKISLRNLMLIFIVVMTITEENSVMAQVEDRSNNFNNFGQGFEGSQEVAPENTSSTNSQGDDGGELLLPKYRASMTGERAENAIEMELGECALNVKSAKSTCNVLTNPVTLMAVNMFQGLGGAVAGGAGKSTKDRCELAATFSKLGVAVNSGLAITCGEIARQCDSTCSEKAESSTAIANRELNESKLQYETYEECTKCIRKKSQQPKNNMGAFGVNCSKYGSASVCQGHYEKHSTAYNKHEIQLRVSKRAKAGESNCQNLYVQTLPAVLQAAGNAVQWAVANDCAKQSEGFSIAEYCAKPENKSQPSCGGAPDCNSPSEQLSRDCLCADPKKARTNPICNYRAPGPTAGNPGLIGGGRDNLGNDALNGLGDGDIIGGVNGGNGDAATKSDGVQQGGGSGPAGGGAGGGINPDDKGGDAKDYKTEVNEGYIKGGKGGGDVGMYGSFGGGSGGGGGRGERDMAKFDLSKYLPGQKKEQMRMMATQGLKAEGVTAASGPSIWEKVSNRMKAIRANLK